MDDVMELPSPTVGGDQLESEMAFYPPRLTYAVKAQTFPPVEPLDCTIHVRGAVEANRRRPLFFNVRSRTASCCYRTKGEFYFLQTVPSDQFWKFAITQYAEHSFEF